MSLKNESAALLPNGFEDLLPPFAEAESQAIRILLDCFSAYGYQHIKPPLLEFEDSLLAPGPGAHLAPETFRLMDPVSHRMLGVRSDITAQVARIVHSRFTNEERPLRLMYANDVLRTRGSQMRTQRQFIQVGCEFIDSADTAHADIEICVLAILGLKALDVSDITLDLTIPGFVPTITAGLDADIQTKIHKAVAQRDVDALSKLGAEGQTLSDLMKKGSDHDALLAHLAQGDLKGTSERLDRVYKGLHAALKDLEIDDVTLSVDLFEQAGFEYHKAFGFTLFALNMTGELGRGGCYDVNFDDSVKNIPKTAKGFTLYMDTLSKRVQVTPDVKKICVPETISWRAVTTLQKEGWVTLRGDESVNECTHIYKDETIIEKGS